MVSPLLTGWLPDESVLYGPLADARDRIEDHEGVERHAGRIGPARPDRSGSSTAGRRRGHPPGAVGRAVAVPVAAAPRSRRAAAQTRGRSARTVLRPGRG